MSDKTAVDLFTPEEHRILSRWLDTEPSCVEAPPTLEEALERLGFGQELAAPFYTDVDAAVAFILLESVEKRLPQWAAIDDAGVHLARDYRPKELVPARRMAMIPQHLFTLNWADSGPGFSWPAAYYATWIPGYDRFAVTDSADCPDAHGYADLAIGHFGKEEGLVAGSRQVVVADWRRRIGEYGQGRWAYLFGEGLVDETEAKAWADEAWEEE